MGVGEGGEALSSPSSPSFSVSLLPAVRHLTLVRCRESDPETACSVKRQTSRVTRHADIMRHASFWRHASHVVKQKLTSQKQAFFAAPATFIDTIPGAGFTNRRSSGKLTYRL